MKINSLYIAGFGKHQDRHFAFQPSGLHLVCGPNEAGKTTFVRALVRMLFGYRRGDRRRKANAPWEKGAPYGGKLTLLQKGKKIVIERDFAHHQIWAKVRGEKGEEFLCDNRGHSTLSSQERATSKLIDYLELGEVDLFLKTCLVPQMSLGSLSQGGISSLVERELPQMMTGGGEVDYREALEELRREYYQLTAEALPGEPQRNRLAGVLDEVEEEISRLEEERAQAWDFYRDLGSREEELASVEGKLEKVEKKLSQNQRDEEKLGELFQLKDKLFAEYRRFLEISATREEKEEAWRRSELIREEKGGILQKYSSLSEDFEDCLEKLEDWEEEIEGREKELGQREKEMKSRLEEWKNSRLRASSHKKVAGGAAGALSLCLLFALPYWHPSRYFLPFFWALCLYLIFKGFREVKEVQSKELPHQIFSYWKEEKEKLEREVKEGREEVERIRGQLPGELVGESVEVLRQEWREKRTVENRLSICEEVARGLEEIREKHRRREMEVHRLQNQLEEKLLAYPAWSLADLSPPEGREKWKSVEKAMKEAEMEKIEREREVEKLRSRRDYLQGQLEEKGLQSQRNPASIYSEIVQKKEKARRLRRQKEALQLAYTLLFEESERYARRSSPEMVRQMEDLARQFSQGRLQGISLEEGGELLVHLPERRRVPSSQLSQGTCDILYLSLRLALADFIYQGASLPLVLDDSFVHLDSQRREKALEILSEISRTRQVLYLSTEREKAFQVERVFDLTGQ